MDTFWIGLLLVTEIVIFLIAFKGDWISPSIVTLAFFILSTACCFIGVSDWKNITFTWKAYLLFSLSFVIMLLVENSVAKYRVVIGKGQLYKYSQDENGKYMIFIKKPFDVLLFIVFAFCACLYVYRVIKSGMSLGAASILFAIGANKEDGDFDTIARLLYNVVRMASYVYIVILTNNIIVCRQRIGKYKKEIFLVLLTILMTFFSGQRSAMICYVIGIVVAAFISVYDHNKVVSTKKEVIKPFWKSARIALVLLLLFFASSNIVKNTDIKRDVADYFIYYFGSTTALMGNIVEDPSSCHYPFVGYFGEKTFMGFWSTMYSWGVVSQPPADRKWINMGSHLVTRAGNEYTFLCGPYIDFGFLGALIFVAIFFGVFSYLYYWKIRRYPMSINRVKNTAIYVFLFGMVIMTFYQDTIRSYSRPINILYILYIVIFCKTFLKLKRME